MSRCLLVVMLAVVCLAGCAGKPRDTLGGIARTVHDKTAQAIEVAVREAGPDSETAKALRELADLSGELADRCSRVQTAWVRLLEDIDPALVGH